jgi:phage antirepressor YoqD-like protein
MVGHSELTQYKQEDVKKNVEQVIQRLFRIFKEHDPYLSYSRLTFIDCTAGDLETGGDMNLTSPGIFLNEIIRQSKEIDDIPTTLFLIEKNKKAFEKLTKNYNKYFKKEIKNNTNCNVKLKNKNFKDALWNLGSVKYRYGLVYVDANGYSHEDYSAAIDFVNKNERVDLLANINYASIARARGFGQKNPDSAYEVYKDLYMEDIIDSIDKDIKYIRDGKHQAKIKRRGNQFTMIYASNYRNHNQLPDNFVPAYSEKGQELMDKYNFKKDNKDSIQSTEESTQQTNTNITPFQYGNSKITFKQNNGVVMINATEMAKPFGKRPNDWLHLPSTRSFLETLRNTRFSGITENQLITTSRGGPATKNVAPGTWMHEDVALEFARWLSPQFAIWCNDKIKELMTEGQTSIKNTDNRTLAKMNIELANRLLKSEDEKDELKKQNKELENKAEYANKISNSESLYKISEIAMKDFKISGQKLNKELQKASVQYKQGNTWYLYREHLGKGYTSSVTKSYTDNKTGNVNTAIQMRWTEKGRQFIHDLVNNGHISLNGQPKRKRRK